MNRSDERHRRKLISITFALAVGLTMGACGKKSDDKKQPTDKPAAGTAAAADIEAGKQIFTTLCIGCHSVGEGDRAGPDLKDVHTRRDKAWLAKWMKDPTGMIQSDPIAKELFAKYKNVPMPPQNLDDQKVAQVLAFIEQASATGIAKVDEGPIELADADFEHGKKIYFDRCAGCHGTLRAGATGPNITPESTTKRGTTQLKTILTQGLSGGMPAWGRLGILNEQEIDIMARYIQMTPPDPPLLPLEKITESWKLLVPVAERPKKPVGNGNWLNYIGVVLRDAGQVAILDGDTKELKGIIDTGFAVHILRSSSTGRYFYAVGRDGKVSLIDLWTDKPTLVAQVQGCFDARSVDGSKYKGYEDKLVIEGCYWPPQYVVMDGLTLEPKTVTNVLTPAYDDNEDLKEVRVAAIFASHYAPVWVANLKESGHVAIIDYSKPGYPIVNKIPAERFLHDGGWDKTGRYLMVAANMRDQMVVVDVKEQKMVTKFKTGVKPHPGRGANWKDPEFGWVNGTTHIGEGKLTVYGADPKGSPDHAWKVVREVPLPSPGGLFLKTHPNSKHVWMDMPLSSDPEQTRQICVYSIAETKVTKCWTPFTAGRAVHFEFNMEGTEVWVSGWDKGGELAVYNDATLEEVKRIKAEWLVTPTGKFNVYNTAHDVY